MKPVLFFLLLWATQVKGKAAIDGLGSRLGKSGASFLQQGLVFAFGNILRAAPIVSGEPIIYFYVEALVCMPFRSLTNTAV